MKIALRLGIFFSVIGVISVLGIAILNRSDSQQAEVSSRQLTVSRDQSIVGSQKPVLVKLDKKGEGKFELESKGMYEVWVRNTLGYGLRVAGYELRDTGYGTKGRWIKAGEVELEKGKHRITIDSQKSEVRSQNKEELKELLQHIEIVILSKEKKREYEELLKKKEISYLFYRNGGKGQEAIGKELKAKGEGLEARDFYIPKEGQYRIRARVMPKTFLSKGKVVYEEPVISFSGFDIRKEGFKDWHRKAVNSTYKEFVIDQGLNLSVVFDGDKDEDEYLILRERFEDVNLREYPYLALMYQVEDPSVQTVQVVFGIKTKKRGGERMIVPDASYPSPASTRTSTFLINAYEEAKKRFPKVDEFYLTWVEVLPHKLWGVDCSRPEKKKSYKFILHDFRLLKEKPPMFRTGDIVRDYPDSNAYYYFQGYRIHKAKGLEDLPEVDTLYRPERVQGVDLMNYPSLTLRLERLSGLDSLIRNYLQSSPLLTLQPEKYLSELKSELEIILELDIDNDGIADIKIPHQASLSIDKKGYGTIFLPALEAVLRQAREGSIPVRPTGSGYHLVGIMIKNGENQWRYWVDTFKLNHYERRSYTKRDLRKDSPVLYIRQKTEGEGGKAKGEVLEVGGKRLEVKSQRLEGRGNDNEWIEFSDIYLKEGNHILNVLENDKFKVEIVEIKPASNLKPQSSNLQPPKVEFRKINPTRYIVDVKGAEGPFTLVFSESFHEGWKAYVRQGQESRGKGQAKEPWSALWSAWKDRGNRIEIKDHFVVNGYANGWIVTAGARGNGQRTIGKDFQIVLEFKPQRLFELGLIISMTTLIGCIGYLGYVWVRRKKRLA